MQKKWICVLLTAAVMTGIAGCSPKKPEAPQEPQTNEHEVVMVDENDGFVMGTWEGRTFSNTWLDMSLTLPMGSYIYTDEDMSLIVGAGQEVLINNGSYTDDQLKEGNIITIYDFMAALPDGQSIVQLLYENTRYNAKGKDMSEGEYLDEIASQLTAISDIQVEIGEKEEVELAGKTFTKLSLTIDQKCLEYYCLRLGNRMATLAINYTPESQAMIQELVDGITAVQ